MTAAELERAARAIFDLPDEQVRHLALPLLHGGIALRDTPDNECLHDLAMTEYLRRSAREPDAHPYHVADYWKALTRLESDPATWPPAVQRPTHPHGARIAALVRARPQPKPTTKPTKERP